MGVTDVLTFLRAQPFVPFRVHMSDGRTFDIRHPDQALVARTRLVVGVGAGPMTGVADHLEHLSFIHITGLEEMVPASRD
ncbi:MAG: hypothetical protein H0T47_15625 [Planctomycetaceae bacterium]|nr:hypothetical protein [Planctomycetaceae bacterium]